MLRLWSPALGRDFAWSRKRRAYHAFRHWSQSRRDEQGSSVFAHRRLRVLCRNGSGSTCRRGEVCLGSERVSNDALHYTRFQSSRRPCLVHTRSTWPQPRHPCVLLFNLRKQGTAAPPCPSSSCPRSSHNAEQRPPSIGSMSRSRIRTGLAKKTRVYSRTADTLRRT
jgi:hypothetical protein